MLHQSHTMVVDHQKEEEYRIYNRALNKNVSTIIGKENCKKWQDIKMNNAVFAVEKDKSYS